MAVHPRVCGELGFGNGRFGHPDGSSPRVRGTPCRWATRRIPHSVHPRVCGELLGLSGRTLTGTGSSPRVRGTLIRSCEARRRHRFIPACAGNSAAWAACGACCAVHPRVCGELTIRDPNVGSKDGSSPRVRGTQRRSAGTDRHDRFIPACAGNSSRTGRRRSRRSVHPRVCGELFASRPRVRGTLGSSPRVRGTQRRCRGQPTVLRFIPACAGNSAKEERCCRILAVHPRVCGELVYASYGAKTEIGSSPRVRGTLGIHQRQRSRLQVHPRVCGELSSSTRRERNDAGSSPRVRGTRPRRAVRRRCPAVHPRVCGELEVCQACRNAYDGSSPRVRGTLGTSRSRKRDLRFIPACAGNSCSWLFACWMTTVHPRVCGELSSTPRCSASRTGSSPRVRGTRAGFELDNFSRRFIPACAGNSPRRSPSTPQRTVHPRVCGELLVGRRATGT